ncbi:ThuA domain-containing protein [Dactylosporangium aurantiacum]|uniref:ThuA domain-containing protein n=1 Tax=Dactylosporangium aurantiacum TaxID=35754 RepID=UPI000524E364|nr:ThuA domain-containing protein [Dactylosporangium aurantiacum]MDG6107828.1 ThuA domain-containing protein [Dactylosporangium aurantiacum]
MSARRLVLAALAVLTALGAGLAIRPALAATPFKVLAFYNGTWDAAHIDFDKEAREWFPTAAAQNGFTWEATTDWSRLNTGGLESYKVIMFLDDAPPAGQRAAFQQYMNNGGAWMGFHVSAFTTDPGSWSWYYNTFLGSGAFRTNTWGPTSVTLKVEDRAHPSTVRLPATFRSAVSEWYSWSNDLRQNPAIDILASVDPSSFPVGTDPNQSWYSGYYPILWTNRNYKMLYANFGHNGMNYSTNTRTSSTFASAEQNRWLIDGILWLAGQSTTPPSSSPTPSASQSTGPISPTAWYSVINKNSSKCVDARAAGTTNGTPIQQYTCNASTAQQYQFQPTSGGFVRINNRGNSAQALDVTDVSSADNAPIQTWTYGGGNNQQWQPVAEGGGWYHFVSRLSGKCLDVPAASTADSVQLVQYTCNGTAAQSFRLA